MFKRKFIGTTCAVTATLLIGAGVATSDAAGHSDKSGVDYTTMTPEALAEYLLFEAKGFKLEQPVQEGGEARQRLVQDDIQRLCTKVRNDRGDTETMAKVIALARESIRYPEGGIKLGDWKIGRELAWSGFGYRVGHRNDDHGQGQERARRQLLQLPPAGDRPYRWVNRSVADRLWQATWQQRTDAQVRLRGDLQSACVFRLHQHAADRSKRVADGRTDQSHHGLSVRPGVSGQPVRT